LPDAAAAGRWFDQELPNLTVLVATAELRGWPGPTWRLVRAASPLLGLRADRLQWISLAEQALAAAERDRRPDAAAYFANTLGIANSMLGRQERAEAHFQSAIGLRAQIGDLDAELASRLNLAAVYGDLGRPADAIAQLTAVVTSAEASGAHPLVPPALNNIAKNQLRLGRADEAAHAASRAADTAAAAGDVRSQAFAHHHLADAHAASARPADAETHYRVAVELAQRCSDKFAEAGALTSYGDFLSSTGRPADARDQWRRAEALYLTLDQHGAEQVRARLATSTTTGNPG
jgi:tetratricopeptide (TPR) repeat protein